MNYAEILNWYPKYHRFEDTDGSRSTVMIPLPGFGVNEIKLSKKDSVIFLTSKISDFNSKEAGVKNFSLSFPILPGFVFGSAELVNGMFRMIFNRSDNDNSEKELPINVPQPSSSSHPQLLNEDSDF